MIVLSIDPGLVGAVASLDADSQLLHLHDRPYTNTHVTRGKVAL
jgi:hypothetical protein